MLQAMGVRVWHRRGTAASVQEPVADAVAASPAVELPVRSAADPAAAARQALQQPPPQSSVAPPPENVQPAAPVEQPQQATVNISFAWLKSAHGLFIYRAQTDPAVQRLYRDVVLYVDWLCRRQLQAGQVDDEQASQSTAAMQPAIRQTAHQEMQQGSFQWPQLQNSSGSPSRSLAVWLDKHVLESASVRWLGATQELAAELQPWLPADKVVLHNVGDVQQALMEVQAKKALWQALQQAL